MFHVKHQKSIIKQSILFKNKLVIFISKKNKHTFICNILIWLYVKLKQGFADFNQIILMFHVKHQINNLK